MIVGVNNDQSLAKRKRWMPKKITLLHKTHTLKYIYAFYLDDNDPTPSTAQYGQWAGLTHPTTINFCFYDLLIIIFFSDFLLKYSYDIHTTTSIYADQCQEMITTELAMDFIFCR